MRTLKATAAIAAFLSGSVAWAQCPCDFSVPSKVLLENSTVTCAAGSYFPSFPFPEAALDIRSTNPRNGALEEYEPSALADTDTGVYYCDFRHFKCGKNGRCREVRRDQQSFSWDGDDAVPKYNGCLDDLDVLHELSVAGGAQELGVTFAGIRALWQFTNSCDPNDGVVVLQGDPYDGSLEPFVPSEDYLDE